MKAFRWYTTMTIIILFVGMLALPAPATTIVLLDISGSMGEELAQGQAKINEAFRVIRDVVIPDLTSVQESSGLWALGGNCGDLRFRGNITANAAVIKADLNTLQQQKPDGITPLAWAIREALSTLETSPEPRNLIIVTDGIEKCGGDPCAEVLKGRAKQMKIAIHTVGLGMQNTSGAFKVLECIAAESHGGTSRVINQPGQGMNTGFKTITNDIVQKNGELLVTVINAKGQLANDVSYDVIAAATNQQVKQGKSGLALPLSPGKYRVALKTQSQDVDIVPGDRKTLTFKVDLGHFRAFSACGDPDMTFSLLDAQNKTIATSALSQGIDLPPGVYSLMLNNYPYLPPKKVEISSNKMTEFQVGAFGEIEILAQDVTGQGVQLPLEIFDDTGQFGTMPVATGATNKVFTLPVGTYNVRISSEHPMSNQMQGGANIQVAQCDKGKKAQLTQTAALYIESATSGSVTIYNDSTGDAIPGNTGELIGVLPGTYNIRCPDGNLVPNIAVNTGKVTVTCP
jgi:hypothetical protein